MYLNNQSLQEYVNEKILKILNRKDLKEIRLKSSKYIARNDQVKLLSNIISVSL